MKIQQLLDLAGEKGATDLHILSGAPILMRLNTELTPVLSESLSPSKAKEICYSLMDHEQVGEFENALDIDFMFADETRNRYRVNVSYNDGTVGAVIRYFPREPLPLEKIRLPGFADSIVNARKGLVLITGTTNQGKTTTMASFLTRGRLPNPHMMTS